MFSKRTSMGFTLKQISTISDLNKTVIKRNR